MNARRKLMRRIGGNAALTAIAAGAAVAPWTAGCLMNCQPHATPTEHEIAVSPVEGRTLEQLSASCMEHCRVALGSGVDACHAVSLDSVVCTTVRSEGCVAGRAPLAPFEARVPPASDDVARWLLHQASDELASVVAFERVAHCLDRLGAPPRMTRLARSFAEDERRHAALLGALAGLRSRSAALCVEVFAAPSMDLEAFAITNVVDGCVNEAFAAWIASVQADRASTSALRGSFASIARDESRHARLAFAIHAWAMPQLTSEQRAHVTAARKKAEDALADSVGTEGSVLDGPEALGLPRHDDARTFLAELTRDALI